MASSYVYVVDAHAEQRRQCQTPAPYTFRCGRSIKIVGLSALVMVANMRNTVGYF